MRIAYVGNFTQSHCTEVHLARTLEDMGHLVTRIQEDPINKPSLIQKVKGHDMFLFTRTWSNLVTLEHLAEMKRMGIPTVSYHLDLYVGLQREKGLATDPFWKTEYVFSPDGDPKSQEFFKSKGINHHYLKPGVFREECYSLPPNDDETLSGDVVFVGGGAEYGHKEWPYRYELVKWLEKNYDGYRKYGHPQRTVRNAELNQLYANAKVVVGDSLCLNFDHPYYWSDRVYETIGRGGFIIHPYIKGMEEEFTDGVDIVFYDFNDWSGLKAKIDYYLNNPEERKKIQLAGQELVRETATYHNRLQRVLDVVFAKDEWVDTEDGGKTNEKLNSEFNEFYENESRKPCKIYLGAGTDIKNEPDVTWINVDHVKLPGIDVVHNLMEFPYPFEDGEADEIHAIDVVEHLDNYVYELEKSRGLADLGKERIRLKSRPTIPAFIEECYRILKPGGVLYIQTPGWRADFLWIDPTHIRGFDLQSFDFFDPSTRFGQTTGFYSDAKFSVRKEELPNHNLRFWMTKI